MSSNVFNLSKKNVLLFGGAGILGARMAYGLASHGAKVVIVDISDKGAEEVALELNSTFDDSAIAYGLDITNESEMLQLRKELECRLGVIDVVVNNAAAKGPDFFKPFEDFPMKEWELVMGVNTTGVMLGCKLFGARMAERGSGSIINTLSIYGVVAPDQRIYIGSEYEGHPISTPAVYSASKAAVWGLTKYLAAYWGNKGVRVNAVTPGGVFSGQNKTFVDHYSERVPLGRMAEKDEVNGAIVFLASDASSYVTGQNIIVDGGFTVW